MKKIALLFGTIAGGIIIVYSLIVFAVFSDFSSLTPSEFGMVETLGYLRYIILLLTVGVTIHTYARQHPESTGYWQKAKAGLLVAVIVAVFVGLMEFGYILLNPDFYEEFGRLYIDMQRQSGAGEEAVRQATEQMNSMKWMHNPVMTGLFYFVETVVIGSVGALVAGLFIRSRRTPAVAV